MMIAMGTTVESAGRLQRQQDIELCGQKYQIASDAHLFDTDVETYKATHMSTGHAVRLTFGLPLNTIDRNNGFSHHLHNSPNVDSKYFLRVHCVTKTTFGDEQVAAQVEDYCMTLQEHIELAQQPFSVRTVEMQLLPDLKNAIHEMRKLGYVHGNLDYQVLHWCPATKRGGGAVVQLGGFYHAHVIPDGSTAPAPGCGASPTIDPEVCHQHQYYSNSDLYSVGGVILQILQFYGSRDEWTAQLIQENGRGLAELIHSLWRPPHLRPTFSEFEQRVDALEQKAQTEVRLEKQESARRPKVSDSFDAKIDAVMLDEPQKQPNLRSSSSSLGFEDIHFQSASMESADDDFEPLPF